MVSGKGLARQLCLAKDTGPERRVDGVLALGATPLCMRSRIARRTVGRQQLFEETARYDSLIRAASVRRRSSCAAPLFLANEGARGTAYRLPLVIA
jgi:hypothetical protein